MTASRPSLGLPVPLTVITVLLLSAISACGSGSAAGSPPVSTTKHSVRPATEKVYVSPVNSRGVPLSGFRVTFRARNGGCIGSIAIGQAYRCFTGNYVLDPCWADNAPSPTVLCLGEPWLRTVAEISLKTPLAALPTGGGAVPPWGLTLANGWRCVLLLGASGGFKGRAIEYGCGADTWVLAGLVTTTSLWHCQTVIGRVGTLVQGPAEAIRIAWYGIPDRFR